MVEACKCVLYTLEKCDTTYTRRGHDLYTPRTQLTHWYAAQATFTQLSHNLQATWHRGHDLHPPCTQLSHNFHTTCMFWQIYGNLQFAGKATCTRLLVAGDTTFTRLGRRGSNFQATFTQLTTLKITKKNNQFFTCFGQF
jgi:hypothetical protein